MTIKLGYFLQNVQSLRKQILIYYVPTYILFLLSIKFFKLLPTFLLFNYGFIRLLSRLVKVHIHVELSAAKPLCYCFALVFYINTNKEFIIAAKK